MAKGRKGSLSKLSLGTQEFSLLSLAQVLACARLWGVRVRALLTERAPFALSRYPFSVLCTKYLGGLMVYCVLCSVSGCMYAARSALCTVTASISPFFHALFSWPCRVPRAYLISLLSPLPVLPLLCCGRTKRCGWARIRTPSTRTRPARTRCVRAAPRRRHSEKALASYTSQGR